MMTTRGDDPVGHTQWAALAVGLGVSAVGGAYLWAWLAGATTAGGDARTPGVATNTSVCLVFMGAALALLACRPAPGIWLRIAGGVSAAVGIVLGAVVMIEHVTGFDLGVDQLLLTARGLSVRSSRMGPSAALSFVLLGSALALLARRTWRARRAVHEPLALLVAVGALLQVVAYSYGVYPLYGLAGYTAIALPTAICLLALALGVLCLRPDVGVMRLVTRNDPGGAIIRRLLLPAILLPIGLGWLRIASTEAGWLEAGVGTTLVMVVMGVSFSALLLFAGRWVGRAETALRESEGAARRQLGEIEAIYNSAHVGLAVFDANLRYIRVNDRLAEMNGPSAADHIGKTVREVLPDVAPAIENIAERILDTGKAIVDVEFSGTTPARPEEVRTWVEQWVPLKDESGTVVGINVAVEEVTERKQMELALKTARDVAEAAQSLAERANRAKDHFLAVLSHELRTPLAPVLTGLGMLEPEGTLSPRGREILEVIRRNVALEARLIDDLLDLTGIVSGKSMLDRREVDLCTAIDRAMEVCSRDIEARGLSVAVDAGEPPYIVHADPARLQQVFWNLLKNAIKFTPPGGSIGVSCRAEGGSVLVEVRDSGIGIEPDELSTIFDAFAQSERVIGRRFGGLGLGLTLSKDLVELHGGTIEAHSEGVDRGASFVVRLPVLRSGVNAAPAPAPPRSPTEVPRPLRSQPLRVLLVEDHRDTADMMVAMLELEGHKVETAGDVATALKLIAGERPFDVLLSDLGLPDRSGLELMSELRERGNHTPGIALSGYGQESDVEQSLAVGFALHLIKPVEPDRLFDALGRVAAAPGRSAQAASPARA